MRIVVSGTHASGKSTLVADFCARHPQYTPMPDPFEELDEADDRPGASLFVAQLALSARRLVDGHDPDVIAERGPLDFLAYLTAWDELGRSDVPGDLLRRARETTTAAMTEVDLLVVLPLNGADRIWVHPEEDLELRDAMDEALLELADDTELLGAHTRVVEIVGDRSARLAALDAAVSARHDD
ncbi:MAG: hypothetical protein J7484_06950 [Microbacterium sp.]|nr:hypothetical protein [Microbacterium sp.]